MQGDDDEGNVSAPWFPLTKSFWDLRDFPPSWRTASSERPQTRITLFVIALIAAIVLWLNEPGQKGPRRSVSVSPLLSPDHGMYAISLPFPRQVVLPVLTTAKLLAAVWRADR